MIADRAYSALDPLPPARPAHPCGHPATGGPGPPPAEARLTRWPPPPGFDREAYKERNTVERCISRLKQWRGLAMRTDKLAIAYQAALHLAAILIWLRR